MKSVIKFKALLGLAQVDGDFDHTEKNYILSLAKGEGFSSRELKEQLKGSSKLKSHMQNLEFEEKIDILTYLVKLMKVDGKVLLSEIRYCERFAKAFGFKEQSIGFLTGLLDEAVSITPNFGRIKYRMKTFLNEAA